MLKSDTSPKLTIIGAGLVGCLAAKYLVKCGFDVTIYENRNDIRKQPIAKGKSINLALSNRGLTALENAGIDVKSLLQISSVPMKGRMIHNENGFLDALLYDVKYKRCIYSIGRNDLNKLLITEAEKVAELNFGCKLLNVDFRNKTLTILRIDNDTQINEKFEHLVGCDGAYSVIRQCMIKTPLFNYNQTYIDHGYIELRINPKISSENNMSVDYLHIWPRRTFMIIALPNQDKSWTVTLFMPFKLFYNIKTSEDLIRFFHKYFIDVLPLIGEDNLIHSFFCSKPQPLVSVKCNRYNINSHTLIIGDAAHAVVPFYGQGMNAKHLNSDISFRKMRYRLDPPMTKKDIKNTLMTLVQEECLTNKNKNNKIGPTYKYIHTTY